LFIDILSVKSFQNNVKRSLKLTSRDLLADYDDYIYDSYGILSYKKYDEETIKNKIILKYNSFKLPLNIYDIESVKVYYNNENIENKELLIKQILVFAKNNVTLEYIEYIANQNKIKEKLSKNKHYNKIKKVQKKILSNGISVNGIMAIKNDYSNLFAEINEKIEYLKQSKNDSEMLKSSIVKLENEYLDEYNMIKKQERIVIEIGKLLTLKNEEDADIERINNKLKEKYGEFEKLVDIKSNSKKYITVINNIKKEINELRKKVGIGLVESSLKRKGSNLKLGYFDRLYLNEYILGTFKNVANSNIRNFELYNKNSRSYVTNSEVEYIINGDKSSVINNLKISSKIFLIREAMNFIHLFIDNDKRKFILTTAEIPVGGFFVAAGLAVVWSGAESIIDIIKLYSGDGTPLLKISDKDFILDLGVIQSNNKIDFKIHDDNTFLYYSDYLRMFLVLVDSNDLVHRMLEVIDVNYKNVNSLNSVENLILKHKIDLEINLKNKLTGNLKLYNFTINEGYFDE